MAAAGGAASIITQVQQGGAAPATTLGGMLCSRYLRITNVGMSADECVLQMLVRTSISPLTYGIKHLLSVFPISIELTNKYQRHTLHSLSR